MENESKLVKYTTLENITTITLVLHLQKKMFPLYMEPLFNYFSVD